MDQCLIFIDQYLCVCIEWVTNGSLCTCTCWASLWYREGKKSLLGGRIPILPTNRKDLKPILTKFPAKKKEVHYPTLLAILLSIIPAYRHYLKPTVTKFPPRKRRCTSQQNTYKQYLRRVVTPQSSQPREGRYTPQLSTYRQCLKPARRHFNRDTSCCTTFLLCASIWSGASDMGLFHFPCCTNHFTSLVWLTSTQPSQSSLLYRNLGLTVYVVSNTRSHSVCFPTFSVSEYVYYDKNSQPHSICFTEFSVSHCISLAQEHLRMAMVDPLCCTKLTLPVQIECGPAELEESMLLSHALQVCADHFEYLLGFLCLFRVVCGEVLLSCSPSLSFIFHRNSRCTVGFMHISELPTIDVGVQQASCSPMQHFWFCNTLPVSMVACVSVKVLRRLWPPHHILTAIEQSFQTRSWRNTYHYL